ncbi:MAG: 3-oxoadipate enol-lactonase [Pseudonocardiaceae bacterium]
MISVKVHHELTGPSDAPVLVLAGSLGSTLHMWDPQVEALAGRFRVLRYDHRGHGGSPVPSGPYTVADLGGDVLALLDRLEIERVAFCGISLGGMAGIWLGAHAPQRLTSLTLCSTTAYFEDSGPWHERAASVRWASTDSIAPEVVERWFTPEWAAQHPGVVDQVTQMIARTSDEGYAACCAAIAAWDARKLIPRIDVPTLVIGGAQDSATPVNPHARILVTGIPEAKLMVLDAAHLVSMERAKEVNDLLAEHAAGE